MRKPSLASPAPMQTIPVTIASAADSDTYRCVSCPASGSTVAATIAQVAASGAMMSCRDDPKAAYASRGRMLAYSPLTGGTPASCAYAIAIGTATAATDTPAMMSAGNQRRSYRRSVSRPGRKSITPTSTRRHSIRGADRRLRRQVPPRSRSCESCRELIVVRLVIMRHGRQVVHEMRDAGSITTYRGRPHRCHVPSAS